jgi:hypothetical protein
MFNKFISSSNKKKDNDDDERNSNVGERNSIE